MPTDDRTVFTTKPIGLTVDSFFDTARNKTLIGEQKIRQLVMNPQTAGAPEPPDQNVNLLSVR